MSSELVKKLEAEETYLVQYYQKRLTDYEPSFINGFSRAVRLVKGYEAQQMKEPCYQWNEEQERLLKAMIEWSWTNNSYSIAEITYQLEVVEWPEAKKNSFGVISRNIYNGLSQQGRNQVFNAFTSWAISRII